MAATDGTSLLQSMKSTEEACLRDVEIEELEVDCPRDAEIEKMENALLENDRGVSDIDFEKLFIFEKTSKETNVKFTMTETQFEVKLARLTKYLDNFQSMAVLPMLFAAILSKCTGEFDPDVEVYVKLLICRARLRM